MSTIELLNITKSFNKNTVVNSTSFKVEPSELITLLGPSGSGKSTLLSIMSGLLKPTSGKIIINDQDVTDTIPAKRNIGMVFQNYALFPHLSVFENIAFPLKIRKKSKSEIKKKVQRVLEMVRLSDYAQRKQHQLSGGQQQRVALARALVFEPEILLLDEPLGALDKKLREEVQIELRQLQHDVGVTTIMVTHDQEEALSLSNRVIVINEGSIQQIDTPENLYKKPANSFVANFIGTANLITGKVKKENNRYYIETSFSDPIPCENSTGITGSALLVIRPENITINQENQTNINTKIEDIIYLGESIKFYTKTANGKKIIISSNSSHNLKKGEYIQAGWSKSNSWLIKN